MERKIKPLMIFSLLVGSIFLGGCSLIAKQADVTTETPTQTITGVVRVAGDFITINQPALENGGQDGVQAVTVEIASRKIDLKQYDGKTVTVTGEFSGTTLFVDELR